MTCTPRERAREQTLAEITRIGREHLVAHGAAALSLRAVARDLGVVSSAVYRYVASRDELLTLLVVDGYNELAAEVEVAVDALPEADHRGRLHALARAVRVWAVREPARYALLYGSPIPGYHAPAERTTGPGTRVIAALVTIIESAYRAGAIEVPEAECEPGLAVDLGRIRSEMGSTLPNEVLVRGVMVWSALFGVVSSEVFEQFGGDTFTEPAVLFEHHLAVLDRILGLV
ncbi:TetR/AcrR family transcriptional regulator [Rhodococcus spongiicola]|uniref:TetR/AcrR family transcriptional regulator n=1 Tax=Rhodococcus spongiicola TaxID=2487352 RepID=A0A3S3AE08_9NOCA|nr:TetR/AcrR family transcriptional regulator [Rhodococcus spongiicola]RVW02362.1 TetR/AcrR family transcriptional regulator [Rhodococcus spongiicola]